MDARNPAHCWGSENPRMARKHYTDEFHCQAVDLYESTPSATLKGIAADRGVSRGASVLAV
ncbi:hypothetical protein GCM10023197_08570 [Gordonia humi]